MRISLPVFIILMLFTPQFVFPDDLPATVPDSVRIGRLAGLCELWGVAKYFHPYLAYKSIDWDEALIKTIPRINKAKTAVKKIFKTLINYVPITSLTYSSQTAYPQTKLSPVASNKKGPNGKV